MSTSKCYVLKYMDDAGNVCPHTACLVYKECQNVYLAAEGVLAQRKRRLVYLDKSRVLVKSKVDLDLKEKLSRLVKGKPIHPGRKTGYKKPGRLMYKDEGTKRDELLFELYSFFKNTTYIYKLTKYGASWFDGDVLKIKADLRRRSKLLVYAQDDLVSHLVSRGVFCRSLYDSERPNFAINLLWVVEIASNSVMRKLLASLRECYDL